MESTIVVVGNLGDDGEVPGLIASDGRSIEVVVVGCATLAVAASHLSLARLGIDMVDEGYFLDLASRLQHGQLPYRDFDTYYTPGLLYLNAAVLGVFGSDVLPARMLMAALRVGCALMTYVLARRLASPAFAAVPAVLVAASGVLVGSNPGWPALLATLLMLGALARAEDTRRRRWLAVAGAAAALAFAFKQNVGAFALAGAAGYAVLASASEPGLVLVGVRAVFAIGIALTTHAFLTPLLDPLLAAVVWLPLTASLMVLVGGSRPVWRRAFSGLGTLLQDGTAIALGAGLLTAAWLVPLAAALGIDHTPIALFLGSVNQGALIFPLDAPPLGSAPVALIAVWAPLATALMLRPRSSSLVAPALLAALATPLIFQIPTRVLPLDPLAAEPGQLPRLAALDTQLGSVLSYLPALAAWMAVVLLAIRRLRAGRTTRAAWFVLVGTLAQLALFPRADSAHIVLAGTPLLVVGAWVLAQVHAALSRGVPFAGQVAIFATLLTLPVAAVAPHLYGQFVALRHPDPDSTAAVSYVPLALDRASVLVPEAQADPLRQAIAYVRDSTTPGAPLFAYPTDPLVNFIADRPNPTRFDHFMPSALSADDMRGVVADLESTRPRYVFWDHAAVVFWDTDHPNRILSDYIWQCYRQVAAFRLYLVLERSTC